jgi:Ca2+-binding EF-hand superfamily protein
MLPLALTITAALTFPVQAQMRGNFDEADTNHDGKVTLSEFEAYTTSRLMARNSKLAMRFKALSPEEQQARIKQRFDTIDTDHNGYLDRKEWAG